MENSVVIVAKHSAESYLLVIITCLQDVNEKDGLQLARSLLGGSLILLKMYLGGRPLW